MLYSLLLNDLFKAYSFKCLHILYSEHELDNMVREAKAVEETEARADRELEKMRQLVLVKEEELEAAKLKFDNELAEKQASLNGLQSILTELQTDSATKEELDSRARAAKAEALLEQRDAELSALQSMRVAAGQAGVLERRLQNSNEEVRRLQIELKKRSEVLSNLLEEEADLRFNQEAEAATSSERAVVLLASIDPSIDSEKVIPPSKAAPGSLLCVRCSRSLNSVMACEADVQRVTALEHSRPCKAMMQLLGPLPKGLRIKPPMPPVAPNEDEEVDIFAAAVKKAQRLSYGPLGLKRLRRMLADAPPRPLLQAAVTTMAYPDWRKFKPDVLAKEPDSDDEDEDQETYHADVHLHFPGSPATIAAEKAYQFSAGKWMPPSQPALHDEDEELSLSVFHGASPWWVRLVMRAILWAKIEDEVSEADTLKLLSLLTW